MTAKEELTGLVGAFSEDEAQTWLDRICSELHDGPRHTGTPATALALLRRWRSEPREQYPDDWDELRTALENDRLSARPLFQ